MKHQVKLSVSMLRPVLLPSGKHVNYNVSTPTRKHAVSIDGQTFYVSNPLKNGNGKLGKNVLVFDLLAVHTCPVCRDCQKACYARMGQVRYPAVFNSRFFNTWLAVYGFDILYRLICEQLKRTKKRVVRIHSSGEFFAQWYVDFWACIAFRFPNIKFYGYTKTRGIFDFSGIDDLPNVNIVDSILEDGSINFGNKAYVAEKQRKYPTIPICPVTEKVQGAECMETCHKCLTCKRMLFIEHK